MQPTVLENVSPDDEVSQHELFGPVTCLYRVSGFDEAVRLANGTHYGLTGAIHTTSLHRAQEFITRYQGGLVSVNGATFGSGPHMPFGGVKNSGNGFREPGTEALDVYTELKTVVINHVPATSLMAKRKICFPITSRAYYGRSQLLIRKLHAHPGRRPEADARRLDPARQVQPAHRRRHRGRRLRDRSVAVQRHRGRQPRRDGEDGVPDGARVHQQPLHSATPTWS